MFLNLYTLIIKKGCGRRDLNPSYKLGKPFLTGVNRTITDKDYQRYLSLRSIEGISKLWFNQIKHYLEAFLGFVDWQIDEDNTIPAINRTIFLCIRPTI